jgi:outer membrane protein W
MRKVALLFVLMLFIAIPTFAESPPNYAVLKLGAYLPQASDVEEFDNSFYGELGFGHYFNPNIALEFGVGYTESSASASVSGVGSADVDLTIIPITVGIKVLMTSENFEPFAMAGIGAYYTDLDASVSLSGIGSGSASESDTTFGGFLGLGANFNVTPNTFLGLEGKYFIASPSFEGIDVDIDGINITANIGYRF